MATRKLYLLSVGVTLKASTKSLQVLYKLKASAILGSGESGVGEEVSGTLGGTLRATATKDSELQGHGLR